MAVDLWLAPLKRRYRGPGRRARVSSLIVVSVRLGGLVYFVRVERSFGDAV